jgi:hypothetical protein
VSSLQIRVNTQTGKIVFDTPVINGYSEVVYDRAKGEKIISRFELSPDELEPSPNATLTNNFDILFAVDTNTIVVDGVATSVTAITECNRIYAVDPEGQADLAWRYHINRCFAFSGARDPAEKAGWAFAVEYIYNSQAFREYPRIGMIVDAYLNDLKSYNDRTSPIVANIYLPKGYTMLYASGDSGSEYLANKLLQCSDRQAGSILKMISTGTVVMPPRNPSDNPQSLLLMTPYRATAAEEAQNSR